MGEIMKTKKMLIIFGLGVGFIVSGLLFKLSGTEKVREYTEEELSTWAKSNGYYELSEITKMSEKTMKLSLDEKTDIKTLMRILVANGYLEEKDIENMDKFKVKAGEYEIKDSQEAKVILQTIFEAVK